jgi:hypothetical protein
MLFRILAKITVSRPKTPVQDPGRALQEHRARVRKQLASKCFFRIFAKTTVSLPKTHVKDPGRALQEHRARVRKQMASKSIFVFSKGLVAGCHTFLFIFHIFFITYIHTFIQSHSCNTFILRHSLGPLSISSSLESSVGRPSLWCRAENRTRACLTASRRATI